jgi:hypothetical protein
MQAQEELAQKLEQELQQFTGTESYYKHLLGFRFTDGVKFLAEEAQAYWLIDAIISHQIKLRGQDFQLWLLVVGKEHEFIKPKPGKDAVLTCWKDTPNAGVKPLVRQDIVLTDFPLKTIKLYLENKILLLPSEH